MIFSGQIVILEKKERVLGRKQKKESWRECKERLTELEETSVIIIVTR